MRVRPPLVICETRHGFICASAGVDASNTPEAGTLVLLPLDPDASAARLRDALRARTGCEVGVIVADSFGRPWRRGTTDVALGAAGVAVVREHIGERDPTGYELHATVIAIADEMAAAAQLVMGKLDRVPVAVLRGLDVAGEGSALELVIPEAEDLVQVERRDRNRQPAPAREGLRGARPRRAPGAARQGAAEGEQDRQPAQRRRRRRAARRAGARAGRRGARREDAAPGGSARASRLVGGFGTVASTGDRTRALVEAGIALSSELSLDAVLQKLTETAATLTGARYAALGVLDPSGQRLERFLTAGIDAAERAAIGDLPTGRGILGALIQDAAPLRLHRLADDFRSVGFPPGHPPMTTFLGVPIALRGVAYGNLYLTEKAGGADFTDDDEEAVVMLGSQAAVAIENARLYESATRWSTQLESLNEVMNVLVTEFDLGRLLQLIATRLRDLLGARTVTIALPHGTSARIEAVAGEDEETNVGLQLAQRSKTMRVLERRRSERVDSVLDDPEIDHESARLLGARTSLYVPLIVRDAAMGVIAAHDKQGADPRFTDDDVRIAEIFAGRAAVAVELSQRVASDALRRVVAAQELERTRLARELHDETGQALTSILLSLRTVEEAAGDEQELARRRRGGARARAVDAAGRPPARRRAASEGAGRLRSGGGARAADRDLRRADGPVGAVPAAAAHVGSPAAGGGDRALPDRAGVADEHRQARPRHERERRPGPQG